MIMNYIKVAFLLTLFGLFNSLNAQKIACGTHHSLSVCAKTVQFGPLGGINSVSLEMGQLLRAQLQSKCRGFRALWRFSAEGSIPLLLMLMETFGHSSKILINIQEFVD